MRVSFVYGEHYLINHDVTMWAIHTVNACTGGPFHVCRALGFPYICCSFGVWSDSVRSVMGADLYSVT